MLYSQESIIGIIEDIATYCKLSAISEVCGDACNRNVPEIIVQERTSITINDLIGLLESNNSAEVDISVKLSTIERQFKSFKLPRRLTSVETTIVMILLDRDDLITSFIKETRSWIIFLAIIERTIFKTLHGLRVSEEIIEHLRGVSREVPDSFSIYDESEELGLNVV